MHRPDGGDEGVVRLESQPGDEPGGAQHPERVVGERDLGIERGAEPTAGQIGQAVVGVDDLEVGAQP